MSATSSSTQSVQQEAEPKGLLEVSRIAFQIRFSQGEVHRVRNSTAHRFDFVVARRAPDVGIQPKLGRHAQWWSGPVACRRRGLVADGTHLNHGGCQCSRRSAARHVASALERI